jgi:hypothetical protein
MVEWQLVLFELAYSSQRIASYRIPMVEKATGFIEINI